jgi:hypothetical protein
MGVSRIWGNPSYFSIAYLEDSLAQRVKKSMAKSQKTGLSVGGTDSHFTKKTGEFAETRLTNPHGMAYNGAVKSEFRAVRGA